MILLLLLSQELLKFSSNDIYFGYFSLSAIHLELKRQIRLYAQCGSLKKHIQFKTIVVKIYTRFQTKTAQKTIPFGAVHTNIAYKGGTPGGEWQQTCNWTPMRMRAVPESNWGFLCGDEYKGYRMVYRKRRVSKNINRVSTVLQFKVSVSRSLEFGPSRVSLSSKKRKVSVSFC